MFLLGTAGGRSKHLQEMNKFLCNPWCSVENTTAIRNVNKNFWIVHGIKELIAVWWIHHQEAPALEWVHIQTMMTHAQIIIHTALSALLGKNPISKHASTMLTLNTECTTPCSEQKKKAHFLSVLRCYRLLHPLFNNLWKSSACN